MRPSMPASHSSPSAESPVDRCPADAIAALDGEAFVAEAYRRLLGRMPNGDERATMLDALLRGEPKSWILGGLRYGAEGRAAAIPVGDAFRRRYLAQRTFRWPVVGPLIERAAALWRLPASLRYFRGMEQRLATARAPAATARKIADRAGRADVVPVAASALRAVRGRVLRLVHRLRQAARLPALPRPAAG